MNISETSKNPRVPDRKSEIAVQIDALSREIEINHKQIGQLENMLIQVLRTVPLNGPQDTESRELVPLACDLNEVVTLIMSATARIDSMIDRLEL